MTCLGFKGGIGSASRRTPSGHIVGVLLMSNFGERERLTIDGVPVGRLLETSGPSPSPSGRSCIVVVATNGPLDSAACVRLARRAGLGLARAGSTATHGSGEIFVSFATGLRGPRDPGGGPSGGSPDDAPLSGSALDPFFAAAVEATEEAVLNSLLMARTVVGRGGNTAMSLPADQVSALLRSAGRI